jgi:hypothetical protein
MIKFNEIKVGDFLIGEYEGKKWEGEVVHLNGDEKQACLATMYRTFGLKPMTFTNSLSDESLLKINFIREDMPDGSVKYKKGSFRMLIPKRMISAGWMYGTGTISVLIQPFIMYISCRTITCK